MIKTKNHPDFFLSNVASLICDLYVSFMNYLITMHKNYRKVSNNAPGILTETHETPFFGSI